MATGDVNSHDQQETATSRARQDLVERLKSPPSIEHQGREWEFVQVDFIGSNGARVPDGAGGAVASVFLRPAGSQDQIVMRADLVKGPVYLQYKPTDLWRKLNLEDKADMVLLERLVKPGGAVRSATDGSSTERLLFFYADSYVRQRALLDGTKPMPRPWRIAAGVDAERVRLKLPESHGIRVPLQELGSVPVRLKGEERNGVYFLSLDNLNNLVVSRAGKKVKSVIPADVVGEHVYRSSYEFGLVPVSSTKTSLVEEATGARPPPSPPRPTAPASPLLDTLSRYGINPLPSGQIKNIEAGPGDQLIKEITTFVTRLQSETPLVIRQWGFEDYDPDTKKYDPVMQDLVSAICQHATKGENGAEVDLVLTRGKLTSNLERTLRGAGVRVHFASNLQHKMVVHQKSVATPETCFICTGPFGPWAGKRMETMVELLPGLSSLHFKYESLALRHGSVALQQKYLADLANQGVVINRPDVGTAYAGRSYWALARGAEISIDLDVKELADPEYTKLLLEKAKGGVIVNIWLSEPEKDPMDKASQRLIREARERNPTLGINVKSYEWNQFPYTHFNSIIADQKVGAFGSLYPWSRALGQMDPPGGGTENGVILVGQGLIRMRKAITQAQRAIEQSGRGTFTTREFSRPPPRSR